MVGRYGMLVQRAYKTELDLTDRQVTACRQHAGAARWAYNWGLRIKQERYAASKKSPTAIELHRELNGLKKTDVPWMYQRLQMCAAGSLVEPGCRLPAVLSPVCPQEAREVDREARVSPLQDQEEGTGQFPAHRLHRRVGYGDRVAAIGPAPAQRAGLSSDLRGKDPLGHRERAGGTLVRVRAGGRGADGTREYRTSGRH